MSWIPGLARLPGRRAAPAALARPVDAPVEERDDAVYVASQWQLMWWKFRRHNMALAGAGVVLFLYLVAIFVEPLLPPLPVAPALEAAGAVVEQAASTAGARTAAAPPTIPRIVIVRIPHSSVEDEHRFQAVG